MNLTPGSRKRYNELAGTSLDRLAGISDGIFAVGMTLLVLSLAVPASNAVHGEGDLWQALLNLRQDALVYTLSFMTLGIFWVGQGTQLGQLSRSDRHYTWIQLLFLFAVTVVPFSTGLLARFPDLHASLVEYWLNIALLGFSLLGGAEYAKRAQLFAEGSHPEVMFRIRGRIWIAQALYLAAVGVSLVLPTWVSIALIILIQLNYVLAPPVPILERF